MAEPQLSIRSGRAREMAHRLARRERRTVADIVERALEAYEARTSGQESAADFFARVTVAYPGDDVNLEALIKADRRPNPGPEL